MGNTYSQSSYSEDTDVESQLLESAKSGNTDKITQFIADGVNVNCVDNKSNTPLMWASAMGHSITVETLIKCKARLEDRDNDNYTALHWAVCQKKLNCVKILLKHKADVNALNIDGDTPLHRAAHYNVRNIAIELINHGANINAQNKLHQTPLDKARREEFKLWLKSLGGKANSKEFQVEGDDGKDNNDNGNGNGVKTVVMTDADKQYLVKESMKNEVKNWLQELALAEYYESFIENGFDRFNECIDEMTQNELKDIGVKMGHIKIIIKSINERKENEKLYKEQLKAQEPGFNGNNNQNDVNDDNNGDDNDDHNVNDGNNENKEMKQEQEQ